MSYDSSAEAQQSLNAPADSEADDASPDYQRKLPDRQLQELHNLTGLPHFQFMKMGPGRKFYDVVIFKASFDLKDGIAELSDKQAGPCLVDAFFNADQPAYSSMQAAGDTVLHKPFSDVYVNGTVRSFQNKPQTSWHGLLRVRRGKEHLVNKTLKFTGPRQWSHKSKDVWRLSKPTPTTQVLLQYELAYGGHYLDPQQLKKQKGPEADKDHTLATESFPANPAGSGLFGPTDSLLTKGSPTHDPKQHYPGPQIEWEADSISDSGDIDFKKYQPAGWGPIARWWSPRVERQGSYDAAWMKDFHHNTFGYADYPKDFNNSYFNCAPADQMIKGALQGDEHIELAGVFADKQTVSVQLPGWRLVAHSVNEEGERLKGQLRLDTVHIDLDAQQLHATWRLTLGHDEQIYASVIERVTTEQASAQAAAASTKPSKDSA
jgi:hypothetical protein